MINPKTIIIPSSLDRLIARRLNLLQDDAPAMKFLTSIVLLGTRVDRGTIDTLGYENVDEIIQKLSDIGYMYMFNNCYYFPNYNLLRKNLLTTISPIYLKEVAEELFEKIFNEDMPSPVKAYLYNLLGDEENERQQWEQLAEINLSLGDFSSYVNSAAKIIEILDKNKDEEKAEEIENYKMQLYENISNNLYQYIPEKTQNIAEATLSYIEKTNDNDKIIVLCNKMINGAVQAGNYNHALELIHKVLSILPPSSLNPADENFNTYFFMMSILHIQILFNIGALFDCVDVGFKVFNVINNETIKFLKPDYFTEEAFNALVLDSAAYVALASVFVLNGSVEQYLQILRNEISFIPQSFDLFKSLEDLVFGRPVNVNSDEISENDRFGGAIYNIVTAFSNFDGDYEHFAAIIHRAKSIAKYNGLFVVEFFADLLIAYAYVQLGNYQKSEAILFNIIKSANQNGMTTLLYAAWYVMGELHLKQHKYNVAFGIVNNSLIQLEKSNTSTEYLLMLL